LKGKTFILNNLHWVRSKPKGWKAKHVYWIIYIGYAQNQKVERQNIYGIIYNGYAQSQKVERQNIYTE
jgi:hypothetical protein